MADIFGKFKGNSLSKPKDAAETNGSLASEQPHNSPDSQQKITSISSETTIEGKILGNGTVKVFGQIKGELRATVVLIAEGAQLDGEVIAEELTIGGRVKGTIHSNRVRLNSSAVVEGDIYNRSLAIEENARFEGSSRREENVVDVSARTQGARFQTPHKSAAVEAKRHGGGDGTQTPKNPPTA